MKTISDIRTIVLESILNLTRNIKPAFHKLGLWGGMAYTGLFYVLGRGKEMKYSIVEIRND